MISGQNGLELLRPRVSLVTGDRVEERRGEREQQESGGVAAGACVRGRKKEEERQWTHL